MLASGQSCALLSILLLASSSSTSASFPWSSNSLTKEVVDAEALEAWALEEHEADTDDNLVEPTGLAGPMSTVVGKRDELNTQIQQCGKTLLFTIREICKVFRPAGKKRSTASGAMTSHPAKSIFSKRAISDACCYNPCTIRQLLSFCPTSK